MSKTKKGHNDRQEGQQINNTPKSQNNRETAAEHGKTNQLDSPKADLSPEVRIEIDPFHHELNPSQIPEQEIPRNNKLDAYMVQEVEMA